MIVNDIISRARIVMQDTDGTRWPDAEYWKWISDAQRAIVLVRPDSLSQNTTFTMAAGSKQTLTSQLPGAIRLLDVIRNINGDGTPGRAVRMVEREILDAHDPSWHTATATGVMFNAVYDNRDPLHFYCYPPAKANQKVEILFSANPSEVTSNNASLSVPDIYADAVLNYVLFRAYGKDAETVVNAQIAQGYLSLFMSLLGVKSSKDFAFSPDANRQGLSSNPIAIQSGGV